MSRKDVNELAFSIVQQAIGEMPREKERSPYQERAAEHGRKGAAARKNALSSKRRKEIARKAAAVRWKKHA